MSTRRKCVAPAQLIGLIVCVGLSGCNPIRMAPTSDDAQAKTFTAKPDRASIYVYHKCSLFIANEARILFDGRLVGRLLGNYLLLSVPPGEHKLYVKRGGRFPVTSAPLTINVDAGENYFVKCDPPGFRLDLVDANTGQRVVSGKRRGQATLGYGPLQVHTPSGPEKTFQFVLKTMPPSARIIINVNGVEKEIGTTPYAFEVGLAGRYDYWPIQEGDLTAKEYTHAEYMIYSQESSLVSVRPTNSIEAAPILDLKCTLIADGFEPQRVERTITSEMPCSAVSVESWVPREKEIVVGLSNPKKPQYVVKVKIDSVPPGADIYAMGGESYLGEKLGTTPAEFEVGVANKRSPDTGVPDPASWSFWQPTSDEGFVTWPDETPPSAQLNFVLLKEGYARQDVTRWTFHTPDVTKLQNAQKTITLPLKTHDEARQERMESIEQVRAELAAAMKRTELELKRTEIANQQELIGQQELISRYLAQLNVAANRVSTSPPGTIVIKQDPHYNREWQDSMEALGDIIRPHSKLSPVETEQNVKALGALGSLIDLMSR